MANRRFEMYQYQQILSRMRPGDSDRDLARARLIGRKKAGKLRLVAEKHGWLDPALPLPDMQQLAAVFASSRPKPTATSLVEPHRDRVLTWAAEGVDGTTIHRALMRSHGFTGSYSAVRRFLQAHEETSPKVTVILDFAPAEAAQVDFGAGPKFVDTVTGAVTVSWFFVMTLCFSRHQYAEIVFDQKVETWLACHRRAFAWFGGVPEKLIIDNPKCAITRACAKDPEVQRAYEELALGYGFRIAPCPPRDPQKKGRVEAGVKYIKHAFLPLRDPADAPWISSSTRKNRCSRRCRTCPFSLPSGPRSRCMATPMSPSKKIFIPCRSGSFVRPSGSRPQIPRCRSSGIMSWSLSTADSGALAVAPPLMSKCPRRPLPINSRIPNGV